MKDEAEKRADPALPFGKSRIYELLSHALGEPCPEFLEFLGSGEALRCVKGVLAAYPCRGRVDVRALEEALGDLRGADLEGLESGYRRLASPRSALLYEGGYHPPLSAAEEMADIAGFYRAFGFGFCGERPDHVSYELDFMRLLYLKEARALLDGDRANAELCRSAQGKFLSCHPARWVGALSRQTEGVPFYRPLCAFLASWVQAECLHHGSAAAEPLPFLSPRGDERARPLRRGKEAS